VTAESFVYLPLHLFRGADPGYWYFGAADLPAADNRAAIVVLALFQSSESPTQPSSRRQEFV
jgi:hypothetical protein